MRFEFRMRDASATPVTVEIGDDFAASDYADQRAEALKVALADHAKWLANDGGKRAVLSRAVLIDTVLTEADLRGADLRGAKLTGASLRGANLSGANLTGANLYDADLTGAKLTGADLTGAVLPENVPAVPNVAAAILQLIDSGQGSLEMQAWHTCGTTHCVAGWAVTLAGEAGAKMEADLGPAAAGALIFAASGEPVIPNFYGTNADALADLRRRAAAKAA